MSATKSGMVMGSTTDLQDTTFRAAVAWGVAFGVLNLAAPLVLWWLDWATAYGLVLPLIAAVYIGFAVADGRQRVILVEACVASAFVLWPPWESPHRPGSWWLDMRATVLRIYGNTGLGLLPTPVGGLRSARRSTSSLRSG